MAINTGGYNVNVLPTYAPVDANLAAFNPAAAMQGAAQGIDMVTGLQKLKDMRQIHEENAKMSAAKNKLLQAQADQQRIVADYEAGVFEDKLAAGKLREKASGVKSEGEIKTVPGATTATLRAQDLATKLAPGDETLAIGGQKILLDTQPFISQSAIDEAKFKQGASAEALRTQVARQNIASVALGAEEQSMFANAEAARLAAEAKLNRARMERDASIRDLQLGTTSKERVEESEINLRNANAEAARATAQATAEKNNIAVRIAEIKAEAKNKMFDKLNNTSKLANELGRSKVVDPTTGAETTMSQLADKYYVVDGDGGVSIFDKGLFMKDLATMGEATASDLTSYQELQRLRAILVKDLVSSIKPQQPAATAPTATPAASGSGGYVWKKDATGKMVKAPIQ